MAVVVEPATPAEITPFILLAYGRTRREAEVAQLALQGKSNKVLARELRISENTVEDHLKAILGRQGLAPEENSPQGSSRITTPTSSRDHAESGVGGDLP